MSSKKVINLTLKPKLPSCIPISLSGSKSESNRVLILQKLYGSTYQPIQNLSNAQDTDLMKVALETELDCVDVYMAGTAMRFLTAYFSVLDSKKSVLLTGSKRMQERPIGILVEALNQLGASIQYENKSGYPPLLINPKQLDGGELVIDGNVSSQFLSALLMIGGKMKNGLTMIIRGELVSKPYLMMTVRLMQQMGLRVSWEENKLQVLPFEEKITTNFTIESDWSSSSYWFALAAAIPKQKIVLEFLKPNSLQADSSVLNWYSHFGISWEFTSANQISIVQDQNASDIKSMDLIDCPDIAQTLVVSAVLAKKKMKFTGLQTLRIKETDRLFALETELQKLGVITSTDDHSLTILSIPEKLKSEVTIETYNDHRMAMAFAPIATQVPIRIENPAVVNKSYPNFWKDIGKVFDVE